jgi:NADH-quinone oxidoreductase subunit L
MFHLFTHAFFKALLFLGAGVVIHYIHSNEITDMGGLRKKLRITHMTFLIACLAIAGIPPFAGFFSKEEILLAAYNSNKPVYWIACFTSGLTAFYMFRLFFFVFYRRVSNSHHGEHKHEGSPAMLIPLMVLAIGALITGFIPFGKYISTDYRPLESHMDLSFSILPVGLATLGIILAFVFFKKENPLALQISGKMGTFLMAAKQKFFIDEMYQFVTKKIIFQFIATPAAWIDKNLVDGFMNLLAKATELFSYSTSGVQSGKVQSYGIWMLGGALSVLLLIIYLLNV